ncbi:hypothetical protein F4678DRAFT_452163 [Xylaria arbuscula]|nr:hypothetical protein F4678DRAFT_452163 [Xylaria arbuscula]
MAYVGCPFVCHLALALLNENTCEVDGGYHCADVSIGTAFLPVILPWRHHATTLIMHLCATSSNHTQMLVPSAVGSTCSSHFISVTTDLDHDKR